MTGRVVSNSVAARSCVLAVGIACCNAVAAVSAGAQATDKRSAAPDASVVGATDEYSLAVRNAVEAYNRDDFPTARKFFSRAHELRPSARTWRGLGTTAFELKYFDDAVRELTFAIEDQRSPLTPELRTETELTLRVARRRLAESEEHARPAPAPVKSAPAPVAVAEGAEPQPSAAVVSPDEHADDADGEGMGGQRIAAISVGALGLVGVGIGVGFGLRSIAKGGDRDRACAAGNGALCSNAGDAAITAGNVSTIAWVAGGAAIVGGLVLWFTGGPSERQPAASARLAFGPGSVALHGTF